MVVLLDGLLELLGVEDVTLVLVLGEAGDGFVELLPEEIVLRGLVSDVHCPDHVLLVTFESLGLETGYLAFA